MQHRWPLVFISVLLVMVGVLAAQDDQGKVNDPGPNERANACFAGGSLEGKCHTTDADRDGDIDQLDVEFMWWCGWYLIRVEYKHIPPSAAPEGCFFEPAPPPQSTAAAAPIDDDDECEDEDDCCFDECCFDDSRPFSNSIDPCSYRD
jgi:hypothetical protein